MRGEGLGIGWIMDGLRAGSNHPWIEMRRSWLVRPTDVFEGLLYLVVRCVRQ